MLHRAPNDTLAWRVSDPTDEFPASAGRPSVKRRQCMAIHLSAWVDRTDREKGRLEGRPFRWRAAKQDRELAECLALLQDQSRLGLQRGFAIHSRRRIPFEGHQYGVLRFPGLGFVLFLCLCHPQAGS